MKITKIGHCCLLIEEAGARLLTDPGTYSTGQDELEDIDAVLITHEHPDHLHVDSLRRIIFNNPDVRVISNAAVAAILDKEGIEYELMSDKAVLDVAGVEIEAHEDVHAEIVKDWPRVPNTGFFFGGKLFYPGDAFIEPEKPVDVLAAPVAGPWMKISEGVDYMLKVKPRIAFPVHDGILKQPGLAHRAPAELCKKAGIEFRPMVEGDTIEV